MIHKPVGPFHKIFLWSVGLYYFSGACNTLLNPAVQYTVCSYLRVREMELNEHLASENFKTASGALLEIRCTVYTERTKDENGDDHSIP